MTAIINDPTAGLAVSFKGNGGNGGSWALGRPPDRNLAVAQQHKRLHHAPPQARVPPRRPQQQHPRHRAARRRQRRRLGRLRLNDDDDDETIVSVGAGLRFAVEQALAKANFLNTSEITVLQAFTLFLLVVTIKVETDASNRVKLVFLGLEELGHVVKRAELSFKITDVVLANEAIFPTSRIHRNDDIVFEASLQHLELAAPSANNRACWFAKNGRAGCDPSKGNSASGFGAHGELRSCIRHAACLEYAANVPAELQQLTRMCENLMLCRLGYRRCHPAQPVGSSLPVSPPARRSAPDGTALSAAQSPEIPPLDFTRDQNP
ncbi:hypothetical protein MY10362_009683 [Beauveria mimosiformis]